MATNTIRIHRVFRAEPEKVYRAFLDPEAMAKWLPPNGFTGKVHQMDAIREMKRAAIKAGKPWPPRDRRFLKLS